MKKWEEKHHDTLMLAFKAVYLLLCLLSFNPLTAHRPFMAYIAYAVALLGALAAALRLRYRLEYLQSRAIFALGFFCASYALSSLLNARFGVLENLQALTWMFLQFFVVYAHRPRQTPAAIEREVAFIGALVVGYTFICALSGFYLLGRGITLWHEVNGVAVMGGFGLKRLWGLYTDPNYGAVLSAVSCVLSVYFMGRAKIPGKIFFCLNAACQIAYTAFSDSRTGLVCLAAAGGIYGFLLLIKAVKIKNRAVRAVVCALACAVVCALCYCSGGVIRQAYNAINTPAQALKATPSPTKSPQATKKPAKSPGPSKTPQPARTPQPAKTPAAVGREKLNSTGDISNQRFDIWKSSLEIFKTRPVFGVSFRNIVPYALANLPQTYIVNNKHTSFASMHNAFFDALVSQGILGAALFAFIIGCFIYHLARGLSRVKSAYYPLAAALGGCVVAVGFSMLFYSEVFYINTAGAFLFWCFMGCAMGLFTCPGAVKNAFMRPGEAPPAEGASGPAPSALISVVMPVYAVEPYLNRAVGSVLAQSMGDFEIILVDDCSPDGCPALCDALALRHGRVRVIHLEKNAGLAAARNTGLEAARGKYVMFMDSDDELAPTLFKELAAALSRPADMVVFGLTQEHYSPWGEIIARREICPAQSITLTGGAIAAEAARLEQKTLLGYAWNKLYRREFLLARRLRFESVELIEDILFNLACLNAAASLSLCRATGYFYARRGLNSLTAGHIPAYYPLSARRVGEMVEYCKKWGVDTPACMEALAGIYCRYTLSALERCHSPAAKTGRRQRRAWLEEVYKSGLFLTLRPHIKKGLSPAGLTGWAMAGRHSLALLCLARLTRLVKACRPGLYLRLSAPGLKTARKTL